MKRSGFGASLYYASDKNIYDALNQHKVDIPTIAKLFRRRNTLVSRREKREDLARYFSCLFHDYYDHKEISEKLGIVPRRERTTSMQVDGLDDYEVIQSAIDDIKKVLQEDGDVVQVSRSEGRVVVNIQYTTIDYTKSEFAQVQTRDGIVEFVKNSDGYKVRNTQNEYLDSIREQLLGKIEASTPAPLTKRRVAIGDFASPRLRSKFFHELASTLPGYSRYDVSAVYVYKARPEVDASEDEDQVGESEVDSHVERIHLRGNDVTRSEILNDLLRDDDYYIFKIAWSSKELLSSGDVYEVEALFNDPRNCADFSFILSGVFPLEEGRVSKRKRSPTRAEIEKISIVVEDRARAIVEELRALVGAEAE